MDRDGLLKFLDWYLNVYENDSMEWPETEKIVDSYINEETNITIKRCNKCGVWDCKKHK